MPQLNNYYVSEYLKKFGVQAVSPAHRGFKLIFILEEIRPDHIHDY